MTVKLSWNQPICNTCWWKREPTRSPIRLTTPGYERCSFCGNGTASGIYVRHDPRDVPYPAHEDD